MAYGDRKSARVDFERGIPAYMMGIDGTWRRDCLMIDVSQTGARYFNTICWLFIIGTIISPFFARDQDVPKVIFAAVLSFILFAAVCIRSGLKRRMRDDNSAE